MKTLISTIIIAASAISFSSQAEQNSNLQAAAQALVAQQEAAVSKRVSEQVNQDIFYALRAMKLPNQLNDQALVAKTDKQNKASKSLDSE